MKPECTIQVLGHPANILIIAAWSEPAYEQCSSDDYCCCYWNRWDIFVNLQPYMSGSLFDALHKHKVCVS